MGRAKHQMMIEEERGWSSSDKFVCGKCVDTPFLKSLVIESAEENSCDFCDETADEPIAAHFDLLMESIYSALTYYFTHSPPGYLERDDSDYFLSVVDTTEALFDLELDCSENVIDAIVDLIGNNVWFERGDDEWSPPRQHEIMSHAWRDFERKVKHRTRYFFHKPSKPADDDLENFEPQDILEEIAGIIVENGLIKTLEKDTPLFRCRLRPKNDSWEYNAKELGAPPNHLARAGRMNPAGISYFYTSLKPSTAIGETVGHPPLTVILSKFTNKRPIRYVDLCNLPPRPPIFDIEARFLREGIIFLYEFMDAISRPISKDGGEHIDYVPSQVVSEYFAQMLKIDTDHFGVDGVMYPSTVMKGEANLVLFPDNLRLSNDFDFMIFLDSIELVLSDWETLAQSFSQYSVTF